MGKIPQPLSDNYKIHNQKIIDLLTVLIYKQKLTTYDDIMSAKSEEAVIFQTLFNQLEPDEIESVLIDIIMLQYEFRSEIFDIIYNNR